MAIPRIRCSCGGRRSRRRVRSRLLRPRPPSLLVRWDSLLVLDLGLDVVDGVTAFDLKSDGLACEGLNKDLHPTMKTEDEMKS
ncbi:hypothetical protein SESBI_44289 [Sesbania bispinosa]|nr:hypothetical protein SESBI_44289 [Sesbania bispinosa]